MYVEISRGSFQDVHGSKGCYWTLISSMEDWRFDWWQRILRGVSKEKAESIWPGVECVDNLSQTIAGL